MRITSVLPIVLWGLAPACQAASCAAKSLKKDAPKLFGADILALEANQVEDWQEYPFPPLTLPIANHDQKPIHFCNVTVVYNHPGWDDKIKVSVWLPLKDEEWNGRFLGVGGGGMAAGFGEGSLVIPVAKGYAAVTTDAGNSRHNDSLYSARNWGISSPGNVNLNNLQTFAYRALDEMTTIGKQVTQTYYKKSIKNSYFNGCSTGGRQAMALAQRFPEQYQGILSSAPAINWATFVLSEYFYGIKMSQLNYFPPRCELEAIRKAAIEACDALDGVKDGVVSAHQKCTFDPRTIVGKEYECREGDVRTITKEAAESMAHAWRGTFTPDGEHVWYGLGHEAHMAGQMPETIGLLKTMCDEDEKNCQFVPMPIMADWIRNFLLKDPDYDLGKSPLSEEDYFRLFRIAHQEYDSIMDTSDPDLTPFKENGGKLLLWHGLGDELIPLNGSLHYYQRVQQTVPDTDSFFRYFEVPGINHCFGGDGVYPLKALDSLVDWVEKGKAPSKLDGESMPLLSSQPTKDVYYRPICQYPKVAAYQGGDIWKAESYECADSFDERLGKDEL